MADIKRGVSLYSYQQTQFFKQLDLEGQIKEVTENLDGADGIEILDEQSLPKYPNPPEEFIEKWHFWIEKYKAVPITMDVFIDVLQFRDHVMSYHECAERLKGDIRLAKKLDFKNVRVIASVPIEIIVEALPVAEEQNIKIGKEVHSPIKLNGQYVNEIVDHVSKTGTKHLGIVPDMGIFQFQPSEVALEWLIRHGASRESTEILTEACLEIRANKGPLAGIDLSLVTAGNVEVFFHQFIKSGTADKYFLEAFKTIVDITKKRIPNPTNMDYEVVFQCLLFSRSDPEDMARMMPYIVSVHGKFYHMTEIPGKPGQYEDKSIDYQGPIAALKRAGYKGYINSEYEGQRRFQDLPFDQLANEVDQVRKHQEMLKRLIDE